MGTQLPHGKGNSNSPLFGPLSIVANGRPSQQLLSSYSPCVLEGNRIKDKWHRLCCRSDTLPLTQPTISHLPTLTDSLNWLPKKVLESARTNFYSRLLLPGVQSIDQTALRNQLHLSSQLEHIKTKLLARISLSESLEATTVTWFAAVAICADAYSDFAIR